ncbi:MAG: hypothetical protein EXQ47_05635 [Bryobacterales bacterium]|nr:hypothetical protein [Bryobacterales bacterium]
MKRKHLFVISLVLAILCLSLQAKTRKGDRFLRDGRLAEAKGDWDTALQLYEQAYDEDPMDAGYMAVMRRGRFQTSQKHVDAGQKLRTTGQLEEALQEFQKALIADPSSAIALQEIKRVQDMLAAGTANVRPEDRGLTPAERIRRDSAERVESMMEPPALKPTNIVIPVLKMNNQPPRVLYDTVAKLAGVNVVFDSQYTPPTRNFNVDLTNTTAEQAFDYLATLTRTFWKAITPNTIFVAEDNVTKRRDYEDDVVKVFYVTNATSVQEFQEIATAIRTVAEIRRVFTYNAQRAMIVRDTVDKVALAEKLIHDLDKPKSEVVVDVIVMEANTKYTRDLAAAIASSGLSMPVTFTGGTTTATSAAGTAAAGSNSTTLNRLGRLSSNQFTTSLPGALLQALLTDNRTKVLNNPQLRASDGQKVSLKIGDRIPYATGSFQTNTAAALVSTQFNYADVGVNVDITPQVHSADEVTLHVEVTVSSVVERISIGGIEQPVIGQRSSIADIRLREGEVNILSGLSQTQDSTTITGLPGLVNIPVLGRLFGSEKKFVARGDMMIALIPHIVRTPDYTAENLRGIYAGTDQVVKINYAPKTNKAPSPAEPAPAAAPPAVIAPAAPIAAGGARASLVGPAAPAAAGSVITVTVQIDNVANVSSVSPLRIKYDAERLRLEDIVPGDLLTRGVVAPASVKDIRNDAGEASLTVTRPAGAAAVTGSGILATLTFRATGTGEAPVTISEIGLKDTQSAPINATTSPLGVQIR